jgi:cytochrome P450
MFKSYEPVFGDILTTAASSFGMDHNIAFEPHGSAWRHSRREFEANFRPVDLEAYQPLEQRAVHRLLRNLLSSPDNFVLHFRQ